MDFGFDSEQYLGTEVVTPYCQFLNASAKKFGLAISVEQAEIAEFDIKEEEGWGLTQYETKEAGIEINLIWNKSPRMLILNKSIPYMTDGERAIKYDEQYRYNDAWKTFSYLVVWFVDKENKPLSKMPFRLKCKGMQGFTLTKHFSSYKEQEAFTRQVHRAYSSLTGDKGSKNPLFYAHFAYQPLLERKIAKSSLNGQSSQACLTTGCQPVTADTLTSIMVRGNTPLSRKIAEWHEVTKEWIALREKGSEPPMEEKEAEVLNEGDRVAVEKIHDLHEEIEAGEILF